MIGQWAVLCRTNNHFRAGEKELFNVTQCGLKQDFTIQFPRLGKNRTYYIQAEEEYWDYAPSGMDLIAGQNLSEQDRYVW